MADGATKTTKTRAERRRERELAEPQVTLGKGGPITAEAEAIEEALEELRHRRECPAKDQRPDSEDSRIEVIRHKVSGVGLDPERGGSTDGVTAIIVRCVECGAQYPDE